MQDLTLIGFRDGRVGRGDLQITRYLWQAAGVAMQDLTLMAHA
jgi:hypothetical protein